MLRATLKSAVLVQYRYAQTLNQNSTREMSFVALLQRAGSGRYTWNLRKTQTKSHTAHCTMSESLS